MADSKRLADVDCKLQDFLKDGTKSARSIDLLLNMINVSEPAPPEANLLDLFDLCNLMDPFYLPDHLDLVKSGMIRRAQEQDQQWALLIWTATMDMDSGDWFDFVGTILCSMTTYAFLNPVSLNYKSSKIEPIRFCEAAEKLPKGWRDDIITKAITNDWQKIADEFGEALSC
ncbi:uncharacterized protein I206_100580 [Kwoniella pini CBS 10737]|uniref:Uncharacterized protein n=1 Tax=Kwoniella pini CBS 10737 TaxID=1296096 RepID=A0A1B9ICU9_9TREE|nr:uncharacterized protein I206_00745 [Kwoniella pini CBS 10737]OCF53442.1 hypothetical protein I206_00745 [Kwoniella pini CBS 10737]